MPSFTRRLAIQWRLHHPKHPTDEDASPRKPFYHPHRGSPRAGRPVSERIPAEDQPLNFPKRAPCFSVHVAPNPEAPIHRLPAEVLLEIASNATPLSRACLALSSKRLFCVISDGFSAVFDHLKLPEEAPSFIVDKDWRLVYQPERWNFLCLLQKHSRQWLACPDCFVLHPAQWFGQTELAMWPLRRSRPQCRPPELDHLSRDKVPRGFVDLCPCIKLTPSKKRTLLAYLHRQEQEQETLGLRGIGTCLPPDSGPWWHQCRAVDGTGVLETKLHPYLLESGDLGVVTEYTWNQSYVTWGPMGRRACPHCYIEGWHVDLSFHQHPHSFNLLCDECFKSHQCRYCSTRVIWVSEPNDMDSSHLSILSTERVLSDEFWMHQVAFPFPRHTKVLYPRSSCREPANYFGSSFAWYNRWYFSVRFLLVNSWHQ